jgi:hypothetical protein
MVLLCAPINATQGHFKSIRDRWQFGDFNIPAFKKKE